jgi:hypothetical protein
MSGGSNRSNYEPRDFEREEEKLRVENAELLAAKQIRPHEASERRARLEAEFRELENGRKFDVEKNERHSARIIEQAKENTKLLAELARKSEIDPRYMQKPDGPRTPEWPDFTHETDRLLRAYGEQFDPLDKSGTAQRTIGAELAHLSKEVSDRARLIGNTDDPALRKDLMIEGRIADADYLAFSSKRIAEQAQRHPGVLASEIGEKHRNLADEHAAESIRLRKEYIRSGARPDWLAQQTASREVYERSLESAERGRAALTSERTASNGGRYGALSNVEMSDKKRELHEKLVHQTAYGNDPSMAGTSPPSRDSGRGGRGSR